MQVWSLGREYPLKEGITIHSIILAWKIPWTEEPGRLQSMGSQRVTHDWVTFTFTFFIPRRGLPNHMVDLFSGSFLKEPPYCFPQWLCQFTFPPVLYECFHFSTPSLAFICRLFDDSHYTIVRWHLIVALICVSLALLSWRRQWQPTPELLPGKSDGQRSLVGCSPWGR